MRMEQVDPAPAPQYVSKGTGDEDDRGKGRFSRQAGPVNRRAGDDLTARAIGDGTRHHLSIGSARGEIREESLELKFCASDDGIEGLDRHAHGDLLSSGS